MSDAAVINIRTDAKVKSEAQAVVGKLGLNLSAVINAYLRHLIRTKSVVFSLGEEPTGYLLEVLKESRKDVRGGFISPVFDKSDEALKWLKNPKKKYASELQ